MVLSWWRSLVNLSPRPAETPRKRPCRPLSQRVRRRLSIELLENRLAPAATITLPTSGFSGDATHPVLNYPVSIANLDDGTHQGLASAILVVTYPTGVFNFPVGGSQATSDVNFGSIPTANGGAANWTLTANSPQDGLLTISLSAKPGDILSSTTGGSLVTINFPVLLAPSTDTPETIKIVSASGTSHTQLVGNNGTYTTSALGLPASGTITINGGTLASPPPFTQNLTTETNVTLTQAAPGLLANATDPQNEKLSITAINGAAYDPTSGTAVTLPSGAMLTINADGSFSYVPPTGLIGTDSFTFTVTDTSGLNGTGTVHIALTPTLSLTPGTVTGAPGNTFTEQVILDNPNQAGTGGLTSFNLDITYDSNALTLATDPVSHAPLIALGPQIPADWTITTNTDTGEIGIGAFGMGSGSDIVMSPTNLALVTITFQINSVQPQTVPVLIVPSVHIGTATANTVITGNNSTSFSINPDLTSTFQSGVDANVTVVSSLVNITPTTLPSTDVNMAYSTKTLTASGGTAPYTFAVSAGTLPTGLTLTTAGVLSGTPTATGTFSFTVKATDATSQTGTQNYSVTISPDVALSTTSLPSWTAGRIGYSQTISASGGTGTLTFSSPSGTLPTGLTLTSTGVLSGTPSAQGSFTFSVTATDAVGNAATKSYTVVINPALTITTTSLPNGSLNSAYNQTISTSGGTGAVTFRPADPRLPTGLTLNSSTGVISGTPTATGSLTFTVTVTDTIGDVAGQSYTLTISTLTVTPASLPDWTANQPNYSQTLSGTGGTAPYTFSQTGTLPTGLTLNTSTGVLSGTPTATGSFSFTIMVTDSTSAHASQNYTITINSAVAITTTSLPSWTQGFAYSQTISTSGGTGTKTFTLTSGTLPTGLTLSSSGILSGTPTAQGNFTFAVTAVDVTGFSANQTYTVTINPAVAIIVPSLPNWTAGLSGFSQTIGATGGTGTKTFTVSSGTLPPGLTLATTGALSGTPSAPGTFNFTLTASDAVGASANQAFSITVNPAVSITTSTLANWTANQAGYSQTIAAAGGTGQLTITSTGTLPTGLTLGSTGVLSGTPSSPGTYTFTATATDTLTASASKSFTVTINPAITITTTTLPSWTANAGYSQTIHASGGSGTLTFTSTGTLPAGLTLNTTGVLSGTLTTAATYNFTVTATDAVNATGTQNYTVTINAPVSINTTALNNWTAGFPGYSQTISTSGGTGSVSLAVTSGTVPSGLTLSSTGVLSGTPTANGSFTFAVTATDSVDATASHTYTLVINPVLTFTTTSLPNAAVNQPNYTQTIHVTGGTGTLTFTSSGTLPTGLTLSSTGVLSGTPTALGSYTFTVTVNDSLGASAAHTYTVFVSNFSITPSSLPSWTVNQPGYSQTLSATGGGTAPFTFSATGTLPTGLTLSSTGILSGTPTTQGSYNFTVTATDSVGATASKNFSVTINPGVSITTSTLANWTVNLAGYSQTLSAAGGTGTPTFSSTGTLPAGLTLSSTGVLGGTPSAAGGFTLSVTATDTVGASGSKSFTLIINPAVTLSPTTLPAGTDDTPYTQTITASGGTGSKTLAVTAITGAIPGLSVPTTGTNTLVITGTPTATGTETFTVTATDQLNATTSTTYSITVNPELGITPTTLTSAVAASPYQQTLTITGGTTPYTAITITGFNAGTTGITANEITPNPTTGKVTISGTPSAAGTFSFTVNVTDTAGATLSQPYSVTVTPALVTHFVVTAATPESAGGFFDVTVTAEDALNKVSTGYTGTVQFSSSDGGATLPANSTLTNGVGTFQITLNNLGSQTITVMDTAVHTLTGTSASINVVNPTVIIVAPSLTGPAGASVFGHTIGFDAFATISQAVKVVAAGGTIYVNSAVYHESLTLNKSLTLDGSGSGNVILQGSGTGTGLTITGPDVSVGYMTVEDFATGLTASSSTTTLTMNDLVLTGNTTGGSITGVNNVAFIGNSADSTMVVVITNSGVGSPEFGFGGHDLLSYSGVGTLALDGNVSSNTLDLSNAGGFAVIPAPSPLGGPPPTGVNLNVHLLGLGSLSGFAGKASVPGLIFTNFDTILGATSSNGAYSSLLGGLITPSTWTDNGASGATYSTAGRTLTFKGFSTLVGGAGADNFAINSVPTETTIIGGGGGDSFQVALGALQGPVSVNDIGGGPNNDLTITGTSAPSTMTVTDSLVSLNNSPAVYYGGLEGLTVNGGAGLQKATVQATAAGTPTTVSASGGANFVIGSSAGLLSSIASPLTISGGSGDNYLYVGDTSDTTAQTAYVTNNAIISGSGTFAPISYSTIGGGTFGVGVVLAMGNGNNNVHVFSTAAGDLYGLMTGNGNSTIAITSPTQTLNTMAGPIDVSAGSGSNLLYVSEAGSSTPDTLSLSATGISSTATRLSVNYAATGGNFGRGVYLVTGSGNNLVRVYGTAAGSSNGIDLGNGNNNVVITSPTSTLNTMAGPIAVQGGSGNNLLYISDAGSTTPDRFFISGVSVQSPTTGLFVSYTAAPGGSFGRGVDVVGSNAGNQMFVVGQLAGSPLGLYGGAGNDTITVYTTPITFYNVFANGQGGSDLLYVYDLSGAGIEQTSASGPASGLVRVTYVGGLPSTVLYTDLTLA